MGRFRTSEFKKKKKKKGVRQPLQNFTAYLFVPPVIVKKLPSVFAGQFLRNER